MSCYRFSAACQKCQQERLSVKKPHAPMQLFTASEPLEFVAIDILGPLPKTPNGNQYLLVMSDRFSKLVKTEPLKRITATAVAEAFTVSWVFSYGPPKLLLSDNGTQFNARFFRTCCKTMGIKQHFTTPYHPQTNGQVERFNRTILAQLRAFVGDDQTTWDRYSHAVTYAYNTQVHSSTGFSPFDLVLSRSPPSMGLILDPILELEEQFSPVSPRSREEIRRRRERDRERLRRGVSKVRIALQNAGRRYKANQDALMDPLDPESLIGKRVFLRRENRSNKLQPYGVGPYKVISAQDRVALLQGHDGPFKVSLDRISNPVNNDHEVPCSTTD
jgi:hypothetical protein